MASSGPAGDAESQAPLVTANDDGSISRAPATAAALTTTVASTADLAKHLPTDPHRRRRRRSVDARREVPYRLTARDVFHGFQSFVVFLAVATVDRNVVTCFYPVESASTRQLLAAVPMWRPARRGVSSSPRSRPRGKGSDSPSELHDNLSLDTWKITLVRRLLRWKASGALDLKATIYIDMISAHASCCARSKSFVSPIQNVSNGFHV
jgi:hypothetical protein